MREIRLGFVGFGSTGQALASLLETHRGAVIASTGINLVVSDIWTASRGWLHRGGPGFGGLDTAAATADLRSEGVFGARVGESHLVPGETGASSVADAIRSSTADIVVEMSVLDVETGGDALGHVVAALESGKHVVSANKGPFAVAYRRVIDLANAAGVLALHESAVMDGTPVFNLVRETLPLAAVTGFAGVLNSTSNFVLDAIMRASSVEEAVAEAQARGVAEADPSMDLDGWDGAAKVALLHNALVGGDEITPADVERDSLSAIDATGIRAEADSLGGAFVPKIMCRAGGEDAAPPSVRLEFVPSGSVFAGVTGMSSALSLETDLMGTLSIIEHDPTIAQTAYGCFSDILHILRGGHGN